MRIVGAIILFVCTLFAQAALPPTAGSMDRDLMEVTVPQLDRMYTAHRYSVTQVVQWYIARIRRYDPIYGLVEYLNAREALARAAQLDADFAAHPSLSRGLLWGVPIVIKENTGVSYRQEGLAVRRLRRKRLSRDRVGSPLLVRRNQE